MRQFVNVALGMLVAINVIGCSPVAKSEVVGTPAGDSALAASSSFGGGGSRELAQVSTAVMVQTSAATARDTAAWQTIGQNGVVTDIAARPVPTPVPTPEPVYVAPIVEAPPVIPEAAPVAQTPAEPTPTLNPFLPGFDWSRGKEAYLSPKAGTPMGDGYQTPMGPGGYARAW